MLENLAEKDDVCHNSARFFELLMLGIQYGSRIAMVCQKLTERLPNYPKLHHRMAYAFKILLKIVDYEAIIANQP